MFKLTATIFAIISCVFAKPHVLAPVAYNAPLLAAAPAVVTATSSQVVARNYNGLAAPLIAAPVAYTAQAVAAPLAYSAPVAYSAAAYATAPFAYSAAAPLRYAAPLASYAGGYVPSAYAVAPITW